MAFEIVQIERDEAGLQFYLDKYKPFRLLALKTAPEVFGSTYDKELAFPDEVWRERVKNPDATTFVVLQSGVVLCTLTTITMSVRLMNSFPSKDPRNLVPEDDYAALNELHIRINGMFTLPTARGNGFAKSLLEHAIRFGQAIAEQANKTFVCSMVVDTDNIPAKLLYEKCGFRSVLEEEYAPGRDCTLLTYQKDS